MKPRAIAERDDRSGGGLPPETDHMFQARSATCQTASQHVLAIVLSAPEHLQQTQEVFFKMWCRMVWSLGSGWILVCSGARSFKRLFVPWFAVSKPPLPACTSLVMARCWGVRHQSSPMHTACGDVRRGTRSRPTRLHASGCKVVRLEGFRLWRGARRWSKCHLSQLSSLLQAASPAVA